MLLETLRLHPISWQLRSLASPIVYEHGAQRFRIPAGGCGVLRLAPRGPLVERLREVSDGAVVYVGYARDLRACRHGHTIPSVAALPTPPHAAPPQASRRLPPRLHQHRS